MITPESDIRSVVFLMEEYADVDISACSRAQQYALGRQLPFAVVYCLDPDRLTNQAFDILESIERSLASFRIPLIVLIGNSASAVATLSAHVHPKIFTASTPHPTIPLEIHTPRWPSSVQSVADLREYVQSTPDLCVL